MSADRAPQNVLFVDDDRQATLALIRSIERSTPDFCCHYSETEETALVTAHQLRPHVAVVDLSLNPSVGPSSGLELVGKLLKLDSTIRVLVLTGHGDDSYGIAALQHGAASFLVKPIAAAHLTALITDGIAFANLRRSYLTLAAEQKCGTRIGHTSKNAAMQSVLETASFAATTAQPLLLFGETGTGKGVIAHAIHEGSKRKGPFVRFQPNFGSYDLISSELFGHTKGAFTGATENRDGLVREANGGTLFIDEVDELPLETQVLLLNVLQEKQFRVVGSNKLLQSDFRLIAATNHPVESLVSSGKMRPDFFHRVAHLAIEIPPLRERVEDIPELASTFLREVTNREKLSVGGFTGESLQLLAAFQWPGNVRQLQAVVEDGAYRASYHKHRIIEPSDLNLPRNGASNGAGATSFRSRVRNFEYQLIQEALTRSGNNQSQAAQILQLDRTSLRRILSRTQ